jgi:hypothetical protein
VRRVTKPGLRIRTLRARHKPTGIPIMEPIIMTLMGATTLLLLGQVWDFVDHQLTGRKGRMRS